MYLASTFRLPQSSWLRSQAHGAPHPECCLMLLSAGWSECLLEIGEGIGLLPDDALSDEIAGDWTMCRQNGGECRWWWVLHSWFLSLPPAISDMVSDCDSSCLTLFLVDHTIGIVLGAADTGYSSNCDATLDLALMAGFACNSWLIAASRHDSLPVGFDKCLWRVTSKTSRSPKSRPHVPREEWRRIPRDEWW